MVGYEHPAIPKETGLQAQSTTIKLHFEKTLEEKRVFFFLFLGLVFIALTLRCINGLKYQRRCHKLTLRLATERLKQIKMRRNNGLADETDNFEIQFQQPPLSYFGKLKRNWTMHIGFLILVYVFMVFSSVVLPYS
uniref:Uncharacterized protein n=1 Tax=Nelumbo nucifera TaxID=4432 RepID=A0A822ZRG8_NELNU|nr:TPA_asm: hypothetical protein HUJ06_004341 [Nelumbo nucifera]